MTKKKNVQDLTLKNKHALDKKLAALQKKYRELRDRVAHLEQRLDGVA